MGEFEALGWPCIMLWTESNHCGKNSHQPSTLHTSNHNLYCVYKNFIFKNFKDKNIEYKIILPKFHIQNQR